MTRICRLLLLFVCGLLTQCASSPQAPPPPDPPRFLEWSQELKEIASRNMEMIWSTRRVNRGATVHPLPVAETEINPKVTIGDTEFTTESFMAANQVSGLLVIKNGRIVLERYGLGRKPDDRWISRSVTKSVSSTLVGAAIKDGYIKSLDEPVTKYIPELNGSAYDDVTLRHILTMTSGIKWNEDYSDANSDVAKALAVPPYECGVNTAISYLKHLPRVAPPGTKFNYNSAEIDLIGFVLSNATGKPVSAYLSEKVWAPFGMEREAVWGVDSSGHETAGSNISATLRDFGRFGLFMLGGGSAQNTQVLPLDWIRDATSPHVNEPQFSYGYLWWIYRQGTWYEGSYKGMGIFGQLLHIIPEHQLVVVINSAWSAPFEMKKFMRQEYFVKGIVDALR